VECDSERVVAQICARGNMKRLLAIGVTDSWEGQWHSPQGNERAIIASPIGKGEEVRLEVVLESDSIELMLLSAEPLILDVTNWLRYRVVKDSSRAIEKTATSVEMILHVSRREAGGPSNSERAIGK
jgi:hypothetical protein